MIHFNSNSYRIMPKTNVSKRSFYHLHNPIDTDNLDNKTLIVLYGKKCGKDSVFFVGYDFTLCWKTLGN